MIIFMKEKKEYDITKENDPEAFKSSKRWLYFVVPGIIVALTIGILVFLIVSGFFNR